MDIDRYKRMVGVVIMGSRNINFEMIREGYAEAYTEYLKEPYRSSFFAAQKAAKTEKKGIWSLPNYERPADFRKRLRVKGD